MGLLAPSVYEVHTAGAMIRGRFPENRWRDACDKADEVGGYIVDMRIGWPKAVYQSPKYRKKHPLGSGGDGEVWAERVTPPASMWTSPPDWAA